MTVGLWRSPEYNALCIKRLRQAFYVIHNLLL